MAENQVMVERKCCASEKWVSTGLICAHIYVYMYTEFFLKIFTQSVLSDELLGPIACSKISHSVCVSFSHPG